MWYLIWFIAIAVIVYFAIGSARRLEERFRAHPTLEKEMERDFLQRATK